jgi:NAD(P)-dependent dehydrogenase (short-subunit alcohol dehydrogenase family)
MENVFNIQDKVVVITGGAGVLCRTIAKALSQHGAKTAIWDIDQEAGTKVINEIQEAGGVSIAVECNVLDKKSIEKARETTIDELGPIDILINGAGGNKKEATTSDELPFYDLPEEAVRFVFDLNFLGTFLTTQSVARDMAARKKGSILNISSMNAFSPLTKIPAYSAAKAAISNFTQWLAVYMCQNVSPNIRVNAIAPGFFLTEQNRFLLTEEKTGQLTQRGKTIIDHTPMAKFGEPEDLLGTVLWLLSDSAEFITGIVVPVDGGFSAFSGV